MCPALSSLGVSAQRDLDFRDLLVFVSVISEVVDVEYQFVVKLVREE